MNPLKLEVKVFFTALMFYTRLPCPPWVDHSEDMLNRATRYFPLMGWIVAGISGLVFWGSTFILPVPVSILLSMVAGILATGAFHEDGWADVCDGFGGGWTKERILTIMKDSATGAYGVAGLVLMLLFKFILLWEIAQAVSMVVWCMVLLSAHSISRFMAVTMIFSSQYVRQDRDSKAKPVAKKPPLGSFFSAGMLGMAPLLFFQSYFVLLLLIPTFLMTLYLGYYFKKWIGGYTGDCLGATQQLCEVVFYTGFLALWRYI